MTLRKGWMYNKFAWNLWGERDEKMERCKTIAVVFVLALTFVFFISSKVVLFGDDDGSGKHSGDLNPQTTVVLNEIPFVQASCNLEGSCAINGVEFRS